MGLPILPFTESGHLAGARLCEFATGSAKLLQAHQDWITKYFVPKIRQSPGAWVDLIGDASMLGTEAKNLALSTSRIAEVERFIKS
jgi:outer membrane protein OmpA-like peptidoglycan-associated protein